MYAIIKSGGKQYRIKHGQIVKLEKLPIEAGKTVDLEEVLMVANGDNTHIGAPLVKDAKVVAEVVTHGRGKKVEILKFKRRKHHMKRQGHRQDFTEVKITDIIVGGVKLDAPKVEKKVAKKPASTQKSAKKAAAKKAKPAAKKTTKKAAKKKTAAKKKK